MEDDKKKKKYVTLVADDHRIIRSVIKNGVEAVSEFIEANDGSEVMTLYRFHKPNIVFLDIHLPNVTGIELVEEILKFDPQAFIIMLSADSTESNIRSAIAKGAKGFMTKPFTREKLMEYFYKCPTIKKEI